MGRDLIAGVRVTKYEAIEIGAFTAEELLTLFPARPPAPRNELARYAVLLSATATGGRRGEILALIWECLDFAETSIGVRHAWKDRHEVWAAEVEQAPNGADPVAARRGFQASP